MFLTASQQLFLGDVQEANKIFRSAKQQDVKRKLFEEFFTTKPVGKVLVWVCKLAIIGGKASSCKYTLHRGTVFFIEIIVRHIERDRI